MKNSNILDMVINIIAIITVIFVVSFIGGYMGAVSYANTIRNEVLETVEEHVVEEVVVEEEEVVEPEAEPVVETKVEQKTQPVQETKVETKIEPVTKVEQVKTPQTSTGTTSLTQDEIELLALVTMAEAEGEPELGQRLVIDTVLNRVDNARWPNSVHEVVYQKGQFTSMWNGRVDRCYVREDICQLVREELANRTNSEVVFFRMGRYSRYGIPVFVVGNHYFSKY